MACVCEWSIAATSQDVRHRRRQHQRQNQRDAALHADRFAVRSLRQGDRANQNRILRNGRRSAADVARLDHRIRHHRPRSECGREEPETPSRSEHHRSARARAKPGSFYCIMRLAPHYELDEMVGSVRLANANRPILSVSIRFSTGLFNVAKVVRTLGNARCRSKLLQVPLPETKILTKHQCFVGLTNEADRADQKTIQFSYTPNFLHTDGNRQ